MIKTVIAAYDRVIHLSFPYMMVIHGRPSDGKNLRPLSLPIEFLSASSHSHKLKYLAGTLNGSRVLHKRHPSWKIRPRNCASSSNASEGSRKMIDHPPSGQNLSRCSGENRDYLLRRRGKPDRRAY